MQKRIAGYIAAVLGIAAVTALLAPFHDQLRNTSVALALLLIVLFVATGWGSGPAFLASVLGMLCFNFFFLPPIYTFTIADPQNWVALAAFFITALTAGQLSARAKRRAAEAEAGRKEASLASAYNRSLIEASLDPLVTIDRDGKITDVNAAAERLIGYSRRELVGTAFADYFTEPAKAQAGYWHVFRDGLVRDYTLEIRHRDGYAIPVLYNASVYCNETDEIVGVVATAHDITERRRAESEIRLLAQLQAVVAELGQRALRSDWYGDVLNEAVTLVARTLDVEYCNVMELLPGGEAFLLRAGVGWKEGYVGRAIAPVEGSQPGYTVASDRPVIVQDAATETRFTPLPRLFGENVVSSMSVVISTREGLYGVLGAHTQHRRTFTDDEVNFLQAVAFVTLCYARLHLNSHCRLDLVDCGHTGVIHVHAGTGSCELLHGDNLPLGIREGEVYKQLSVPLTPEDVLLFYSDGITEARNTAGELFGADRLAECARLNRELEPEALVEAICQAVFTFSGSDRLTDDTTCLAIKVLEKPIPLKHAELEIHSDLEELSRAREFVRAFCDSLPGSSLDEDRIAEFVLAVNEATCNIVKHAYRGRADQRIQLEAEAFPGWVLLRLHHFGESFDPSTVSPPVLNGSQESGFGIHIITQNVDEARYYRDERGKNCIALMKLCKPQRAEKGN